MNKELQNKMNKNKSQFCIGNKIRVTNMHLSNYGRIFTIIAVYDEVVTVEDNDETISYNFDNIELYDDKTLKEKYWQTGNVFEMSTGEKRVVWFDNLINESESGFISKAIFNDNLINTDSTIGEQVIRIYAPNKNGEYFKELIKTRGKELLWKKSDYIFTEQEIKEKLNIPEDEELIIIRQ